MKTIRLGISPCPNDVYIFSGIIIGAVAPDGFTFVVEYEDVQTLNEWAQAGYPDVVKISYANYLRCRDHYDLLPCGGALGRGCGPLLLSNGGDWDPERGILVPGKFTTANFLLDFYLDQTVPKHFLPFDQVYEQLLREPGAQGVVIHEKRFTYARDGLTLVEDLGRHWEEQTGFAIPLGAIAVRRDLDPALPIADLVRQSLLWAESNRAEAFTLCRKYAQDLDDAVIRSHIGLYVNEYSFDLGPDGQAAVDFFLAEQQKSLPPS